MDNSTSINPLPPGTRIHEFVIRESLGRGGVGIVYAAEHEILRETFAVKEFLPRHLAYRVEGNHVAALPGKEALYEKLRHKFLEEGQTLIQLARPHPHPNLVQVTDAFRENGTVYLCMRLERGLPLDEILEAQGTLGEEELKVWLFPLLDGLTHAHACRVWHRDIKPSNIFIREDGTPLLIDFGAAHHERPDSAVSEIAQYTPNFAAPEQMFGGIQGPWTDIYSMAATCFAAMTGHSPSPRLMPGWQAQCHGYNPGFLKALEAGLQFDPERRPQSVAQWKRLFEVESVAEVETLVVTISDAPTEVCAITPADLSPSGTASVTLVGEPSVPVTLPNLALHERRRWLFALAVLVVSVLGGFQARDWIGSDAPPPARQPEPTAPAVPVATVPPSSLAEQLNLVALACARVELIARPGQDLRLSGYLRDRQQLAALVERLQSLTPQAQIDDHDLAFAAPFCDILARMDAASLDLARPEGSPRPEMPTIQFSHQDRIYYEGEYLVLTVTNRGAVGGYLYLDFVDSNQEAVHLFPTAAMPNHFIAPGEQIVIGAQDDAECERQPDACFVVSKPHGNNLVMATWSTTPLLKQWRIPQSEPVNDYLSVLIHAIGDRARPTVDYYFFTTMH